MPILGTLKLFVFFGVNVNFVLATGLQGFGPTIIQVCCVSGLSQCQLTPLWAAVPCQADHGTVQVAY